jgi:hypothetical protein
VFAAEPFGLDAPSPSPPAFSGTEQAVVARYWELGRIRPALAFGLEAGYAYVRPSFAAGYGRPYWSFIGVETYPMLSLRGVGQYAGVTASVPGLGLRAGSRYYFPFSRTLLAPRSSYSRADIEREEGPRADYVTHEAELNGTVPFLRGSAFAIVTGYHVGRVPDGYLLFEETLHAVMKPPWLWRARLGYLLALGKAAGVRIGAAGEVIGLPGRDVLVVRAGLLGSVLINAHLEAQASFIPVVASPDRLGLMGGDFGQLGVRMRWATGSKPDPARVNDAVRKTTVERRQENEPSE